VPFSKCDDPVEGLSFLWQEDKIYIMDNHRAALWCWIHSIRPNIKYSIFHIDAHHDADRSEMQRWKDNLP